MHAPSLKIFVYEGWNSLTSRRAIAAANNNKKSGSRSSSTPLSRTKAGKSKETSVDIEMSNIQDEGSSSDGSLNSDWCSFINQFDVVVTTYITLQHELNVARAPPIRPRREVADYSLHERSRSPLIMCAWHRVIMDEVQMVGGGKASYAFFLSYLSSLYSSDLTQRNGLTDPSLVFLCCLRYTRKSACIRFVAYFEVIFYLLDLDMQICRQS